MEVTVRRSTRAKYMRLKVAPGGAATLTVPWWAPQHTIQEFLKQHDLWLRRAVGRMTGLMPLPVRGRRAYLLHREEARAFIEERLRFWNAHYGFRYGRIAIRDQRSLWGSCSRKGNLNFSYALLFLPRELADYVIVHELCHLREHNHSARFWALVAQVLPDYQQRRKALKTYVL